MGTLIRKRFRVMCERASGNNERMGVEVAWGEMGVKKEKIL